MSWWQLREHGFKHSCASTGSTSSTDLIQVSSTLGISLEVPIINMLLRMTVRVLFLQAWVCEVTQGLSSQGYFIYHQAVKWMNRQVSPWHPSWEQSKYITMQTPLLPEWRAVRRICVVGAEVPRAVTLLRLPNPILWTADVFHSGRGGTNWTAGGCCFNTPKGRVQRTASHL